MAEVVMERNRIYCGDCRVLLSEMDPESVQMVVTSPPYYPALRDYAVEPTVWSTDPACDTCDHDWIDAETKSRNNRLHVGGNLGADGAGGGRGKAQDLRRGEFCRFCSAWLGVLGSEPSPEAYVEHLVQIFRQVWRVLRSDGTVWLNIGDSHAGGGRGGNTLNRPGVKQDTSKGSVTGPAGVPRGAKAKDLLLIPDMLALALRADGWYFRQKMIWDKPNPMPESVESRPTTSHEFIFLLAKSGTAQYWSHRAYRGTRSRPTADYVWIDRANDDHEVCNEPENWREETYELGSQLKVFWGSDSEGAGWIDRRRATDPSERPRAVRRWSRTNLWRGHDYYYDHVAIQEPARYAGDPRGARPDSRRGSDMKQISERTVTGSTRSKRSVWRIVTEPFKGAHFAAYPTKLVEPCIHAGSSHRACPVCGAPWARVVQRDRPPASVHTGTSKPKEINAIGDGTVGMGQKYQDYSNKHPPKTTGWLPTCGCDGNDGTARCLVLDPFMGSGTTAVVARNLGRDFSGFDANGEYVEMARKRIQEEAAQSVMIFD